MKHSLQPNTSVTRSACTLAGRNVCPTRRLTLLGVGTLLAMSAMAQAPRPAPAPQAVPVPARVPTLVCCKCLGGVSTLDLSTTATSAWRVNGNPVVPISPTILAWDSLPPAIWVGPTVGANQSPLAGRYRYTLAFSVPACEIGGPVTISGQMLADDEGTVRLTKSGSPVGAVFSTPLIAPGPPGWGFKLAKVINFSYSLPGPGNYVLTAFVTNLGPNATGMVVKATASRRCGKRIGQADPPHDDKP